MKYKYEILVTDTPTASVEQLNRLGGDNWLLITIINWDNKWYYYFYKLVS